jgi:hypothetical protein
LIQWRLRLDRELVSGKREHNLKLLRATRANSSASVRSQWVGVPGNLFLAKLIGSPEWTIGVPCGGRHLFADARTDVFRVHDVKENVNALL